MTVSISRLRYRRAGGWCRLECIGSPGAGPRAGPRLHSGSAGPDQVLNELLLMFRQQDVSSRHRRPRSAVERGHVAAWHIMPQLVRPRFASAAVGVVETAFANPRCPCRAFGGIVIEQQRTSFAHLHRRWRGHLSTRYRCSIRSLPSLAQERKAFRRAVSNYAAIDTPPTQAAFRRLGRISTSAEMPRR
jgi:hypothetical protein